MSRERDRHERRSKRDHALRPVMDFTSNRGRSDETRPLRISLPNTQVARRASVDWVKARWRGDEPPGTDQEDRCPDVDV